MGGRRGDTLGLRADQDVQMPPIEVVGADRRPIGSTRDDVDLGEGRVWQQDGEQCGDEKTSIHGRDLPGGETRD
jgi:hypothetical protein